MADSLGQPIEHKLLLSLAHYSMVWLTAGATRVLYLPDYRLDSQLRLTLMAGMGDLMLWEEQLENGNKNS